MLWMFNQYMFKKYDYQLIEIFTKLLNKMLFLAHYSYFFEETVRYNRDSNKYVRSKHEILSLKHVEPNQMFPFVRYIRVFVITVIVITEFDCS